VSPLSKPEQQQLNQYAKLFNDREFDQLREILSAEVHLELVSQTELNGKKEISNYFGNYDRADDWLMAAGLVEDRPAMLVFDRSDITKGPAYFVLLTFNNRELCDVRDFRYARYAIENANWERIT
jgi:RNA polymerase sigma-70 factor (ECF subfamily)